jgi:DNA-binding MarR family transcriptional regulator
MARSPRPFYLIGQLNAAVRLRLERVLREFDLTVAQYTAMSRIKGREVLSSAKLARAHHVSPQTMNELIGNLEARGLVARREDPDNRRVLLVSLTEAGRELLAQCDRAVDGLESEFFASLDGSDLAALRKILDRLLTETRKADLN